MKIHLGFCVFFLYADNPIIFDSIKELCYSHPSIFSNYRGEKVSYHVSIIHNDNLSADYLSNHNSNFSINDVIFLINRIDNYLPFDILRKCISLASEWYLKEKGGSLHSSAITTRKEASFLFLGNHGHGKSTICEIAYSMKYQILGDDINFFLPSKETPSSFTVIPCPSLCSRNMPYSTKDNILKCIFIINKSPNDSIKRVDEKTAFRYLYESYQQLPIRHSDMSIAEFFKVIRILLKHVPVYELHFTKSSKFLDLIRGEYPDAF